MNKIKDNKNLLSTVLTASKIIEYISGQGSAYPVSISKNLSLTRSNVHRLLATLENLGYLEEQEDGKYNLTFKLFELGNTVPHNKRLIDSARPSMLRLAHLTGQTVNHGILHEDQVLYIDKVEASTYLKLDRSIGSTDPIYNTSLGKVLLAFIDESEAQRIISRLDLVATTPNSITDPAELLKEIEHVRNEGVAFDRQELSRELNCVAAPIFDSQGKICSAISISGPAHKFTKEKVQKAVPNIKATVREITRVLCQEGA